VWPYRKKTAAAGISALTDDRLIEQYARVRSMSKRELHWALRSRQGLILALGTSLAVNGGMVYALDSAVPAIRMIPLVVNVRADGTALAEPVMSLMPADVQDATREHAILWGSLRRQCDCLIVVRRAEAGIAMTEGVRESIV
jgi:hypothetical protein